MASKVAEEWTGPSGKKVYRMLRTWQTGKDRTTVRPFEYQEALLTNRVITSPDGSYGRAFSCGEPDGFGVWGRQTQPTFSNGNIPSWSSLETAVYEKLKAKAYNTADLLVDIGEGRQTLKLIGDTLRMLKSPLRTLTRQVATSLKRNRKGRGGLKQLVSFGDAWLTFRYGVRPLMKSVYDYATLIDNPLILNDRVKARSTGSGSWLASSYPLHSEFWMERGVSAGFNLRVTNPNYHLLEQAGVINPALVIWELVPLSFVFDWFLPVGTWLQTLSDYAGITRTNLFTTRFCRSRTTLTQLDPRNPGYESTKSEVGVWCQRSARGPSWTLKGTRADLALTRNTSRAIDAITLLVNIGLKNR